MVYSPWGHKRVGHDLATKQQYSIKFKNQNRNKIKCILEHSSGSFCVPLGAALLQCPEVAFPKYDLCKRKPFHEILTRDNFFLMCAIVKFWGKAGVYEKARRFFILGILRAFNSFREYPMCTLSISEEGCYTQPSSNIADHVAVLLSIYCGSYLTGTHNATSLEISSATAGIVSLSTHFASPAPGTCWLTN